MTSSATARAKARRQMRNSAGAAVPQITSRRDASAAVALDYSEPIPTRQPSEDSGSHLRLVEEEPYRRSRAMSKATILVLLLSTFIIAVIIFQATIAEQQLRLDSLTRDLRMAEVHHDNLRQQRAELLMPSRLREEAVMMGMYQGMSTKFLEVPAAVVAEVQASTAKMNPLFADPPPSVASAGVLAEMAPLEVRQP